MFTHVFQITKLYFSILKDPPKKIGGGGGVALFDFSTVHTWTSLHESTGPTLSHKSKLWHNEWLMSAMNYELQRAGKVGWEHVGSVYKQLENKPAWPFLSFTPPLNCQVEDEMSTL